MIRPATVAVVAAVVAGATGCGGSAAGGERPAGHRGGGHHARHRPHPAPTRTVIRNGRTVSVGTAVPLRAQRGVSLRLTATGPAVSRTRLSSSYGYPPQHGYYVTFEVTVANTGRKPVSIGPTDFFVRVGGSGRVTSYDGNAPYSGASAQLDNTVVEPGRQVHAPLTYDVSGRHGKLSYAPDGSPAVSWRF